MLQLLLNNDQRTAYRQLIDKLNHLSQSYLNSVILSEDKEITYSFFFLMQIHYLPCNRHFDFDVKFSLQTLVIENLVSSHWCCMVLQEGGEACLVKG